MKIVFWGTVPGQSGNTSNLVAVAVMSTLIFKKSTLLLNNHFLDKSLEKAILGKAAGLDMFEDIGLDSLLRNIKISELKEDIIRNSAISLYNNRIHILPGTTKENKHMFETEMSQTLPAIINSLNKFYDFMFMDLVPGAGEISKRMKEEADVIVVNFPQNKNVIDDFFSKYHLPGNKTVYLIGKYNGNSRYNLTNLERSFPCLKNRTAVIPYNVEFMDALADGKLLNYMIKNMVNGKGDENIFFMKMVKQAVDLMFGDLVKAGGII
ncbi:MAG: hypothetical protein WCD89_23390 [Anaerocolumna sp.]